MKTRMEYVERLTGNLKGLKGVVFEDTPYLVHLIDAENYAQDEIDGERYAPFPRWSQEYKTLNQPKPDINVGDTVKHTISGEIATVKQITLGETVRDKWFIIVDGSTLRYPAELFKRTEPLEPMTIYTVYYRPYHGTNVTGVEMNARDVQHAIEEVFEWVNEMDNLSPEEVDICHVEVSNA